MKKGSVEVKAKSLKKNTRQNVRPLFGLITCPSETLYVVDLIITGVQWLPCIQEVILPIRHVHSKRNGFGFYLKSVHFRLQVFVMFSVQLFIYDF